MARATPIVPPTSRVRELRVMRRPKMRRALWTCATTAGAALVALLVSPVPWNAPLPIVLLGAAVLGGVSAVVLWFVEPPREIVVRRVDRERAPVVH